METSAKLKSVRLSPQKTRLVVDMVRGKAVQEALNILKFSPQRPADVVAKLVRSAVANAEQKGVSPFVMSDSTTLFKLPILEIPTGI